MTNEVVISLAVILVALLYVVLRWLGSWRGKRSGLKKRRRIAPKEKLDPKKHVVVDGSNVMHWGGDPSAMVLNQVLVALSKKGLTPLVVFDANVAYKLWGRHTEPSAIAKKIGVPLKTIEIVPSGTQADGWLLKFAIENGLRVVTNDRFMDWRVQYPKVGKKGFLVKGDWKQGSVIFRGF